MKSEVVKLLTSFKFLLANSQKTNSSRDILQNHLKLSRMIIYISANMLYASHLKTKTREIEEIQIIKV